MAAGRYVDVRVTSQPAEAKVVLSPRYGTSTRTGITNAAFFDNVARSRLTLSVTKEGYKEANKNVNLYEEDGLINCTLRSIQDSGDSFCD